MMKLSLLNAVNTLLSNIGQSPVTSLESPNPLVAMSTAVIDEVNRSVQAEGWVFNSEQGYPFPIDINGEIPIPENVLSLDTNRLDNRSMPVIREGKLYDKYNHTFVFKTNQELDVVWLFDFEDLPEAFKNYITIRAANLFAMRSTGSAEIAKYSEREELNARAAVMQYEAKQGDYNMLSNRQGQNIVPGYLPLNTVYRY